MTLLKYFRDLFRIPTLHKRIIDLELERNKYKKRYEQLKEYIKEIHDDIHSYEDGE